jgi:hypothetical protein
VEGASPWGFHPWPRWTVLQRFRGYCITICFPSSQVLSLMVESLTQFFEENGLPDSTSHAVLDEQMYSKSHVLMWLIETFGKSCNIRKHLQMYLLSKYNQLYLRLVAWHFDHLNFYSYKDGCSVLWEVMPYCLSFQAFGLLLTAFLFSFSDNSSVLKMEEVNLSETSVNAYQTTWCLIPAHISHLLMYLRYHIKLLLLINKTHLTVNATCT